MTNKEAIQVLKNHNNRKYELVNKRRYAVSVIEQDLEVLDILKQYIQVEYEELKLNNGSTEISYWLSIQKYGKVLIDKDKYEKIKQWLKGER